MVGWPGPWRLSNWGARRLEWNAASLTQAPPSATDESRPWLARPVSYEDISSASPDRTYPYGSTGQGRYAVHHGVEFARRAGTPVLAVADGTVVVAGSDEEEIWGPRTGYYGLLIILQVGRVDHGLPVFVLYGHLSAVNVRLGQRVQRGQPIGLVGSTGIAGGPHLHLEVRVGRNAFSHTRNPELWFEPLPGRGTLAGRVQMDGHPVEGALVTIQPVERPDRFWRDAWTYTDAALEQIQSDDTWGENWASGDVPAGDYVVRTRINGRLYTRRVQVKEARVAFVSIEARTPALNPSRLRLTQLGDGSQ